MKDRPMPGKAQKNKVLPYNVLAVLGIIFLGCLIYSHTLHAEFLFDDLKELSENFALRHFPNSAAIWHYSQRRFLPYLSFAMNYSLGRMDVTGYHAVNILVHLFNSVLVFFLTQFLFQTPALKKNNSPVNSQWIAFFTGLIFLTHPLQTGAVTYVIQRIAVLAAFFYLGTLVLYLDWRLRGRRSSYILALLSCIAAMLSKENAFTLPIAVFLVEAMFFDDFWRQKSQRILRLVPFLLCLGIIPWIFLMPGLGKAGTSFVPSDSVRISRGDYLLTQFNVLRTYLRLLFFPVNQNLDYDYPISQHFAQHGTWLSFGLLSALLALAVFLWKRQKLVSFGILWFFLTLSVESGLAPLRDVIFEHRLYLPMFGFALAMAAVLQGWVNGQRQYFFLSFIVILPLAILTYRRNETWTSGIRLWQDVIRKSPRKWRPYHNLAFHYNAAKQYDQAIEFSKKALAMDPSRSGPYLTMGIAYDRMGQFDKEIEAYQKASERVLENLEKFYNDLGTAYAKKGDLNKGIENFEKAIKANPDFPPSYGNLGFAYDQKGEYDKAIGFYQKGIALDPCFAEAYNQLGIAYGKKGDADKAIAYAQKALEINPHFADADNTIGVSYGMKKDYDRMIFYLKKSIAEDPRSARAYANLANAYASKGDMPAAQAYAQKAVDLAPRVVPSQA